MLALSTASCTALLGDFSSGESSDASVMDGTTTGGDSAMGTDSGGPGLGKACTKTTDCATGQTCADGVCCESACDGVCESCNQAGALGHCNAIPAMTDPDKECVMIPLPEAGPPPEAGPDDSGVAASTDGQADGGDGGDAADEASVPVPEAGADAGAASEGGTLDAGDSTFNLPDAGVSTTAGVCAGSCNGARKCAYPDEKTACGTQFCNSSTVLGGFSCDGTGHCEPSLSDCQDYVCNATDAGANLGACGTSCSKESDCSDLAFCDGTNCKPKLGDGIMCTLPNQCETGFCVGGVCCNQACDPGVITGGTCTASGSVGECTCPHCTGAGNSCILWYRDFDGDTYGDKFGTVTANPATAMVGCSMASPPAGWVTNNGDCDDHDGNVNPGQAGYFTKPSLGTSTYDYNCDGVLQKQLPEFLGATCGTCENNPGCGVYNCGTGTGATSLACRSSISCISRVPIAQFTDIHTLLAPVGTITAPIATIGPVGPPVVFQEACCGAGNSGITSFNAPTSSPTGSCGVAGTKTTCGNCNGAGSGSPSGLGVTQGCH